LKAHQQVHLDKRKMKNKNVRILKRDFFILVGL
jgi:hypothetical protein